MLTLLVVVAAGLMPRSTAAQVAIQILDRDGRPLPAVRIDVYGLAELIEVVSSDADGQAFLTTDRWSEVRRLSLSHLGYQTHIIQAGDIPSDGVLRITPEPVEIGGLEVTARGELCPAADDPVARGLWSEIAARYSPDTGARALSGTVLSDAGSVRETELFRIDESHLSPRRVGRDAQARRRRGFESFEYSVSRGGYSWTPASVTFGRRTLHRVYPELELRHAYHFATRLFGDLHDFTMVSERQGEAIIAFCPNGNGPGTSISGVITLVPGEKFVGAEWRFHTDDPDEGAGGEVVFVAPAQGRVRMPHLLAQEGIFFRHNGRTPPYPTLPRTYYRAVHTSASWQVLPGEPP